MAGKRIAVFSLFALVALALTVFASSGTSATTYKVGLSYSLVDTTAGANSDTANTIVIAAPDYNYEDSSMFTLTPIEGWAASGDTLPIGAKVGDLAAASTVGLINGPCATKLPPSFPLYNASVDTSDELSPSSVASWLMRDKDAYPIPDTDADGLEDYLEKYPHFLNDGLDPDRDGPLPALQPRARYAGHAFVANLNILIQIVVFYPGQLTELGGIYDQLGEAIGSPSLVVLNNPVNQESTPGAISDFCTPLLTTTTLYDFTDDNPGTVADESDYVSQRNPEAGTGVLGSGTHIARNYSRAERDADGDGIENDLDPCPYNDDTGWDPRAIGGAGTGDEDNDGLPDTCDPTPTTAKADYDDDGYNNRQDVCPLVPNGCKDSSCHPTTFNPAWDNQADSDAELGFTANADLGPNPDSIGDACDDSDNDGSEDACGPGTCTDGIDNGAACDGSGVDGMDVLDPDCASAMDDVDPTPWGSNPGGGLFFHSMPWSAICVPDTNDDDGDGYCNALETTLGSPTNNGPETGAECIDPEDGATECDDAVDDDGDTVVNDGCPKKASDDDTDDAAEDTAGRSVNDGCDAVGAAETQCTDDVDNDGDTTVNDGCPQVGDDPESGAECIDPEDGATECDDAVDDDGDTNVNDGCPSIGIDDDADTVVNDGCPKVGDRIETGAECLNDTSDDTGGAPGPDNAEETQGVRVNDGCPVIGVPESLVIDVTISASGAQPSVAVPQSCSDGVDNDGDTDIDAADNDADGCDPSTYNPDLDHDGYDDASDNCGTGDLAWNPEQGNTDMIQENDGATMGNPPDPLLGDVAGDVCDDDDDSDGYNDSQEWYMGTDPQASCPQAAGHDAWPLDQDQNKLINLTGDAIKFSGGTIGKIIANDPQYRRQDMDGNGLINLTGDAIKYAAGTIGSVCTTGLE